jgi:hypothetical protein
LWNTHEILLGECKWGLNRVDRQVVRELVEKKTPLVLRDLPETGKGWKVHYALFARRAFTPGSRRNVACPGEVGRFELVGRRFEPARH